MILGCHLLLATPVSAVQTRVAVAANFTAAFQQIAQAFTQETGHEVQPAFGSTGALYAQIVNGAPFDLLLAADQARPARLVTDGLALAETRFTYAQGGLALWAGASGLDPAAGAVLSGGSFRRLAIANPVTAPYGAAAREVLQGLGLWEALRPRIVQGENIAQAYHFVSTGSAELGFVALSQVRGSNPPPASTYWVVPRDRHAPVAQDAVLLRRGADNPAARALLAFLRAPAAQEVIRSFGYTQP